MGEYIIRFVFSENLLGAGEYFVSVHVTDGWRYPENYPYAQVFARKINALSFRVAPEMAEVDMGVLNSACGRGCRMFQLTARQAKKIHCFQRNEIMRLANDRQFAAACSLRPHYSRIGAWLPPGGRGRVLEIGCGPGLYVAMLASMGYDVVGVDPTKFETWEISTQRPAWRGIFGWCCG